MWSILTGEDAIGYGPKWFGYRNDIPAKFSIAKIVLYTVAVITFLALILGVLTARRRRISTFFIGCLCCGSLFSILNGKIDPSWHVGKADILSSYCMFDPTMFVRGEVGLNIGLSHFNITYRTFNDPHLNISFNNHFDFFFGGRHQAIYSYKRRAFDLGLPNAMISVAEYMETSGGGFQWASNYPTAGYFAEVALDYALCSNVLQIILIVLIPHVGIRFFFVTGVLMTLSIWIYWFNVPSKTISIVVESNKLELNFGLAFYIILVVGVLDILFSIVIFMLKKCRCMRTISTFFELDYDTPWDNKTIKEDSKQRKEQLASSLATKVFVDSRLRASVRRFRESIRMKRRTKSQSEVNPSKRLVFHEESWMSNHDDLEGSFMQHSDKERTSGLKIPSVLIAASVMNRRPKLPLGVRRFIQKWVGRFVFFALILISIWSVYNDLRHVKDVTKAFGFGAGRRL